MVKLEKLLLPDYLKKSISFLVDVNFPGAELSILGTKSTNYIYEIKDQKITNSLKLNEEIKAIKYAYLNENEKLVLFYVVLTTNKLFIIKRFDSYFEVSKVYDEVEEFQIHDFECLGYPQIEIQFKKFGKSIVKFPVSDIEPQMDEPNSVAESLEEKLQIVRKHVEELENENFEMSTLCKNKNTENCGAFPTVCFSKPIKKCTEKPIVIAKWVKVVGGKLVLGMKIRNEGKGPLSNLEFQIYDKVIKDYSYKFFTSNNTKEHMYKEHPLFSSATVTPSVAPGDDISIVGAVSVAALNLAFRTRVVITCHMSSGKLKEYLVMETFEVSIHDVVQRGSEFFDSLQKSYTVEDLQAIKTAKAETRLKIESANVTYEFVENLLQDKLKFKRMHASQGRFYYCTSGYLSEVLVALRQAQVDGSIWEIILYTSEDSQIYFIVSVLLEIFPEYTTVKYDEE